MQSIDLWCALGAVTLEPLVALPAQQTTLAEPATLDEPIDTIL